MTVHSSNQDGLCSRLYTDTHRICAAVFNSKYFKEKMRFPIVRKINGYCTLETVSFQTIRGKTAAKRRFREWMLSCKFSEEGADGFDYYLLSHAYQSNQLFVYFRDSHTGLIFPENLITNVRLPIYFLRNWFPNSEDDARRNFLDRFSFRIP